MYKTVCSYAQKRMPVASAVLSSIDLIYQTSIFCMDIRQLQFLCALDEQRHFGRAAEACHVTQPTLSMRLRNLEEELGVTLIERRQRFEGFTPEGERLLIWARQAVRAFTGMKTEARRLHGTLSGTLRIGMVPLSHVGLMPLLQSLHQQAPELRFSLQALPSGDILEQLQSNQLDIGLTYLSQIEMEDYYVHPLGSPAVGLLYHPGHFQPPSQSLPTLPWQRLAELPLGLLTTSMRFRQGLERGARAHNTELNPVLESDSVEHLLEATTHGLCCTLIPLPAPLAVPAGLNVVPLQDNLLQPALGLVCRREDYSGNPLVQALMQQVLLTPENSAG